MIELAGVILGFFSGVLPDIFGLYREKSDRKHELAVLDLQLQQQSHGHQQRLREIEVSADIAETQAIYRTYTTHIRWIDAYNGTVRPTLAYAFFLLYLFVKTALYQSLDFSLPWSFATFWDETDRAFLFGVISYYFGQRGMSKVLRKG